MKSFGLSTANIFPTPSKRRANQKIPKQSIASVSVCVAATKSKKPSIIRDESLSALAMKAHGRESAPIKTEPEIALRKSPVMNREKKERRSERFRGRDYRWSFSWRVLLYTVYRKLYHLLIKNRYEQTKSPWGCSYKHTRPGEKRRFSLAAIEGKFDVIYRDARTSGV